MEIVIIGTGNTAAVLGRKLQAAGHRIVQVFGRDSMKASELAYDLGTESTNYWNVVVKDADIYIIAVSDIAVEEVLVELNLQGKTVVHTAASVSKEVLKNATNHFGVFYPLQSLRKGLTYLPEIPVIIDASDEATMKELDTLAHTISDKVIRADDAQRMKLHLAAVFCNNFVNHLYTMAEKYCKDEGIDFYMLLPLIRETAARLDDVPPSQTQTGPAIRNDRSTMEKHVSLLEHHPHMKKIYELLSESIYNQR
jgi:predicted short-subunit dehydrogenase-like oxidoreductase (DUF2520 family)